MALLRVEELSVTYRHEEAVVRAVERVSLTVEPGEVVALVGESGCGKTSVALALTRLLPSSARVTGNVMFEGSNLLVVSKEQLRRIRGGRITYVFQDPGTSLNPVLTIGEQLVEAIELHAGRHGDEARRAAGEWLRHVGITSAEDRLDAYPHEFSGGMQQRVMLAMAIAAKPALLVADEPTTALDVTIQVQILRLLRELQRTLGLSVLLISHDLGVVERLAHRVGVMLRGELVEFGNTAQVLSRPAHPYTKELLRYRAMLLLPQENQDRGQQNTQSNDA